MPDSTANADHRAGQRIAKIMARAGLCSRREAEAWVLAGRVSVNGERLASPAYNVSETDDVRVDGEPLRERERTRLFLFHKPRGLVTTARDPEGRPTIFEALPPDLPRVVAIGRLDINTEGLILLTNDGGLARILELPATGWLRRYRVRAHGAVEQGALDALSEGVTIEDIHYAGIEAKLERQQGSNVWLTMGLREGKNREIKRVLEHLGLSVNRLIRVSFGPFELGDLGEGEVEETPTRVLRDQLGPKLAREAGVDFDAAIVVRAPPVPPPEREARRGPRQTGRDHAGRDSQRKTFAPRGPQREQRDPAPRAHSAPEPSHPQRKRKHVGKLRAEIAAGAEGPRKRIERSATADRRGRVVAVERILPSREEQRRRDEVKQKAEARRSRRGSGEGGGRSGARSARDRDSAARGAGDEARRSDFAPRRPGAERPPRGGKSGGKPGSKPRGKPGGSRPPRRP